ncbi:MAG: hypothetical protein GX660_11410, partial [Clostridiaceae bacterium]|nr:hypothetical protein [Clostridiaceae bacterium]
MKFVVHNIKLSLDENIDALKKLVSKKSGINMNDIKSFRIVKESIDARKKPLIYLVYSVLVETEGSCKPKGRSD